MGTVLVEGPSQSALLRERNRSAPSLLTKAVSLVNKVLYPIVWVSYQHCFPNLLGSQYQYDRFKLACAIRHFYKAHLITFFGNVHFLAFKHTEKLYTVPVPD